MLIVLAVSQLAGVDDDMYENQYICLMSGIMMCRCWLLCILSLPWLVYMSIWLKESSPLRCIETVSRAGEGRRFFWFCAGVSLLALLVMLSVSPGRDITWDESFSLSLISFDYGKMISLTGTDVHPPLYYIMLKAWVETMQSILPGVSTVFAAKLMSVIPIAILLAIILIWCRRSWGRCTAGVAALLLCCSPQLLEYSVTVRMYSWLVLYIVCGYIQLWRLMRKNTICNWLLYALIATLAIYTHNWGGVYMALLYLYAGVWSIQKGWRTFAKWCMAVAIPLLCYLPWLDVVLEQFGRENGWGRYMMYLVSYPCNLVIYASGNMLALYTVCICAAGAALGVCRQRLRAGIQSYACYGVAMPILVIGVVVAVIVLFNSRIFMRLLIPGIACAWLAVSILLAREKNARVKGLMCAAFVSMSICSLINFTAREYKENAETEAFIRTVGLETTAVFITNDADVLFTFCQLVDRPVYAYMLKMRPVMKAVFSAKDLRNIDTAAQVHELLRSGRSVYLITKDEQGGIRQTNALEMLRDFESDVRCSLHKCGTFRLRWYRWSLYRVGIGG